MKYSNELPSKSEMSFYYRNPEIKKKIDDVNDKLFSQVIKIGRNFKTNALAYLEDSIF